ncbi:MAG TPA: alpha/beta fold hydrolase, partial [Microlunatus sp.]|nr:alpha/beta fold hydrolase [Microlunatus sp.]
MSQLTRLARAFAAVGATATVLAVTAVSPTLAAPRPEGQNAAPRPEGQNAAPRPAATPLVEERKLAAVAVPRLRWSGCGAELKAFQCATATVPLDYDEPNGRTITVALTRLPATDRSHRIGSLFTNPGGPGGSGVDFVQQGASVLYSGQVRARFDIIGFDPRGVSRSTPATCFPTPEKEQAALSGDLPFPLVRRQLSRMNRETAALARACVQTSAERLRHLSTANVARDLELLRRAVGDARLSYAGYSYGTYLGATYAKLFP